MSIGPLGFIGSAAGTQYSQAKGSETERTQQDEAAQSRQTKTTEKAENAAGIGETEQDEQAGDRDADGRRIWERPEEKQPEDKDQDEPAADGNGPADSQSKDPTGHRGNQLDLSG